jgi:hypothetical protein
MCNKIELLPIPVIEFSISQLIILFYQSKQIVIVGSVVQKAVRFYYARQFDPGILLSWEKILTS